MIKDLSHLDKQLENRQSTEYTPQQPERQSLKASQSKQEANDLLNSYLNSYQNEQVNKSHLSHVSQKSKNINAELASARQH